MSDSSYLDWPFFEPAHRELAARIARWTREEISGHEADDIDAATRQLAGTLGAADWLRYSVPASHGGAFETLDVRSLCVLREALAYADGLADFAFAMQGLGSASISLFGSDELKDRYLPGVMSGERLAAFALSEADAGSDIGSISTSARRDGNDFVLDGEKTWISNGGIAAQYIVFARTGEDEGARGLSAFVVDADAPGLEVAERIDVIAPHPLARIVFEGCRVPATNLLGKGGDGFKIAMATLDIFRPTVAAAAVGFSRRALDEALAHARSRRAFGRELADFGMIQAKLADMVVKIDAAALLTYRAAWVKDSTGGRVTREAAIAKLYATETGQEVIDEAVQIFGGLGVVSGMPVERLYREIRALRIYEGTSEIQKLVIARQTLDALSKEKD